MSSGEMPGPSLSANLGTIPVSGIGNRALEPVMFWASCLSNWNNHDHYIVIFESEYKLLFATESRMS